VPAPRLARVSRRPRPPGARCRLTRWSSPPPGRPPPAGCRGKLPAAVIHPGTPSQGSRLRSPREGPCHRRPRARSHRETSPMAVRRGIPPAPPRPGRRCAVAHRGKPPVPGHCGSPCAVAHRGKPLVPGHRGTPSAADHRGKPLPVSHRGMPCPNPRPNRPPGPVSAPALCPGRPNRRPCPERPYPGHAARQRSRHRLPQPRTPPRSR